MRRLVLVVCVFGFMLSFLVQYSWADIITGVARRNSYYDPPMLAGPLVEDSLSYVDRTHEYNGIPAGLVGAEYVKVANNDKYTEYYELDVILSQSTTLYLFLDHRLGNGDTWGMSGINMTPKLTAAGMSWVAALGFIDTGWDMGLDEMGDGPIDQYFSIFSKDVGAGTITLRQQYDATNPADRNMYGVAAIPEPMSLALVGLGALLIIRNRRQDESCL